MTVAPLALVVATAPGLEALTATEMAGFGLLAQSGGSGTLTASATADQLVDLLLGLRTASRVGVRLGEFQARTFGELERHATALPWSDVLPAESRVHFRITSKKSRLYHEGALAERLERIAATAVSGLVPVRAAAQAEALEDDVTRLPGVQRIVVRVFRDRVTVSADAAGAGLHRRGYRRATAKAPLRETLAAAMLLGSGWAPGDRLVDPLVGSGTIVIEAALLSQGIAPGIARRFAAECWPMLGARLFDAGRRRARARELMTPDGEVRFEGRDRDRGAIEAATANAERAGVAHLVRFHTAPLSALPVDGGTGWIVSNPPYGVRIGDVAALRNLYAGLGRVAATRRADWSVALLSANRMLVGHVGAGFEASWQASNGGIGVTLWVRR
jgi:putative N6-adenine-specific DNA methylase